MKMCLNRYHDFFLVVYQFVSDNCNMSTTTSSASSPLYQLRSQGHPEKLLLFFIFINISSVIKEQRKIVLQDNDTEDEAFDNA